MKKMLIFWLMISCCMEINAQDTPFVQKIPKPGNYYFRHFPETFRMYKITPQSAKAKKLYETEKGRVYALPLDNMFCLVPEIFSNMPVYKNIRPENKRNLPYLMPGISITPGKRLPLIKYP